MDSPRKRLLEASPSKRCINELSPKRTPKSPKLPGTPPQWKRPSDVMKMLYLKKRSLASKLNTPSSLTTSKGVEKAPVGTQKRKNPFRIVKDADNKLKKPKADRTNANASNLFLQLGLADPLAKRKDPLELDKFINKVNGSNNKSKPVDEEHSALPVDWAMRKKLRFMATNPFPWTDCLRTHEEASGLTEFVRCNSGRYGVPSNFDSSEKAQFFQHCLYWQFPHFPWLKLYPRLLGRKKVDFDKSLPSFGSHSDIKTALHNDFTDAFRSVFQLVRTRLCPFFYLASNSFNCLFLAAGVNGNREITAVVSPSTQGFRQMLRNSGIEFEMPLRSKDKERTSLDGGPTGEDEVDEDDHGETKKWLESLGVADKDIKNLSSSNLEVTQFSVENDLGDNEESTVYIYGGEVLVLFNMLINHRTLTSTTGPLAGVPPTLMSPVAFNRASLINLETRGSIVQVENDNYYSIEVCGPVMPHTIQNLCNLLKGCVDEYSMTCATDLPTISFSKAINVKNKQTSCDNSMEESPANPAFTIENLSDCGLKDEVISQMCLPEIKVYDSVTYSDGKFTIV